MPVIAQKDVLQRDVNVYIMELSAVLIVMEASLAITRHRCGTKWYVLELHR